MSGRLVVLECKQRRECTEIIQVNVAPSMAADELRLARESYVISESMMENRDLSSWINDEILSCTICFHQYSLDNKPKLLACSHTFCRRCICDVIGGGGGGAVSRTRSKRTSSVECPVCRQKTDVVGGADELRNNYTVMSLMDMVRRAERATVSGAASLDRLDGGGGDTERGGGRAAESNDDEPRRSDDHFDRAEAKQAAVDGRHRANDSDRKTENGAPETDDWQRRRKTVMEAESTPCQTCLALRGCGGGGEATGFCQHRHPLRPPPLNPDYGVVSYGYVPEGEYVYERTVAGYSPNVYDGVPYDADHVTYVGDDVTSADGLAYGEGGLCDEFVTHVTVDDGGVTGCGRNPPRSHLHSPTGYGMPLQVSGAPPYQQGMSDIQDIPSVHYHTQMVPHVVGQPQTVSLVPDMSEALSQRDVDVGLYPAIVVSAAGSTSATPPRHHSPPPAYSEIDENPQPAPHSAQSTPQQRRKEPRTPRLAAGKRKVAPPARGQPDPRRVDEQRHVRSSTKAPEQTTTTTTAVSHNDANSNGHSTANDPPTTKLPSGSPAARRTAPRPPPPPPPPPQAARSPATDPDDPGGADQSSGPSRSSVTPPRRLSGEPQGLPFKCVRKFGCYSAANAQSGLVQRPTRVSASRLGDYVIVTDPDEMTVQTFTYDGDFVYKFKALGVQGACMWARDRLAVATHHGVDICTIGGYKEHQMALGSCTNVVPYRYGFIAVRAKTLVFFNNSGHQTRELMKRRHKASSPFKKYAAFERIRDVAVSSTKDIAVLETSGDVYVIDDDGLVKYAIQPANEPCGRLADPFSVTFDRWSNVFVTDLATDAVLRFSPNGKFSRTVLDFGADRKNGADLRPYGLSTNSDADHLMVLINGRNTAHIRIYKLY